MNRLLKTVTLLGALCASAGAWANIITFSGLDESRGSSWPFLPIIYQGLEIDPGIGVTSTAGHAGAVGPQALNGEGSDGWGYFVRGTHPFVLNAINVAPLIGQLGSNFDVEITAYSHGVQVATIDLGMDENNSGYQWLSLANAAGFNQPIDTLYFLGAGTSQAHGFFLDALNISPIPEPETWALMGLGAVGLFARRRKQRAA